jgi:hypothetical protein
LLKQLDSIPLFWYNLCNKYLWEAILMDQALELRLKTMEDTVTALKKQLAEKEQRIQALEDIEAIKRLQCAYGYYLEHWMSDEIIDLFADRTDTSATFVEGTYLGIEGVRRYFGRMKVAAPEFLHMVMQVSPVITLCDDGVTAMGRWYGYGTISSKLVNNKIDPTYMAVIYEMVYVKEAGVWKILKLAFQMHYAYGHPQKLAEPPAPAPAEEKKSDTAPGGNKLSPDIWAEYNTQYGSGYIYPMHFVHPVTGKATQENFFNSQLTLKPSPFQPPK